MSLSKQIPKPDEDPIFWHKLAIWLDTSIRLMETFRSACRFPDCPNSVSDPTVDFCPDCWAKIRPPKGEGTALCTRCCKNAATKTITTNIIGQRTGTIFGWCAECYDNRKANAVAFWKPFKKDAQGNDTEEMEDDGYLGNWWPAKVTFGNLEFDQNEQWMMFWKAVSASSFETAYLIYQTTDAKKNKKYASRDGLNGVGGIPNLDVAHWDRISPLVVLLGLFNKFNTHSDLRDRLMATGNKMLIEASPYDKIWGVGFTKDQDECYDPAKWVKADGKDIQPNRLGNALMIVRHTYRQDPNLLASVLSQQENLLGIILQNV